MQVRTGLSEVEAVFVESVRRYVEARRGRWVSVEKIGDRVLITAGGQYGPDRELSVLVSMHGTHGESDTGNPLAPHDVGARLLGHGWKDNEMPGGPKPPGAPARVERAEDARLEPGDRLFVARVRGRVERMGGQLTDAGYLPNGDLWLRVRDRDGGEKLGSLQVIAHSNGYAMLDGSGPYLDIRVADILVGAARKRARPAAP